MKIWMPALSDTLLQFKLPTWHVFLLNYLKKKTINSLRVVHALAEGCEA